MYKPTLYITMEADPSRYNPEGEGLASRLWSFTAPVALAPSPTMELSLKVRMKCAGRPYWGVDETNEDIWENVARPFLEHKLKAIVDVLHGINDKHYSHYEGAIHFVWLKLQLAPYELRVRLDADAEDNDYIPDVLALVERVRDLVNQGEFHAFADGDENVAIYLPCRADVDELKTRRAAEAEAYAAWKKAQEAAEAEAAEAAEADDAESESEEGDETTASADAVEENAAEDPAEAADESEASQDADETEEVPEKPELSPGLEITTVEFVKVDGSGLIYDLTAGTWQEEKAND